MKEHSISENTFEEIQALKYIVEGTASVTGSDFFNHLVKNLAQVLNVKSAWVTELLPDTNELRALAFWLEDHFVPHYQYKIAGTPCEPVIENCQLCTVMDNVIELFPDDPDLPPLGAVSYMGIPLLNSDDELLGHLAVLDSKPLSDHPSNRWLMQIFASRASAELQRIYNTQIIMEREEQLTGLFNSAMDAIVELDHNLKITRSNPAACKILAQNDQNITGEKIRTFFTEECWTLLSNFFGQLKNTENDQPSFWIPESLHIQHGEGSVIPVEASLSRFEMHGDLYITLILRNILEREKAERLIETLLLETRALREEIADLEGMGEMLGQSKPMQNMFAEINQVAYTDATVLIQGETGTGKELVARAIHEASPRSKQPLVKVNCAAIPATLMESEFFGHEKGAFTGATSHRQGRFALADGGTIFLDEIGELSLELQVKLLRVLQEGEFEPVGSSKTISVDVRVLAATNRALLAEVREGNFREDLYYRLNVFPVDVPPLRDRGADIALLAEAFAQRIATKIGREILPLSLREKTLLQSYDWPGNVRELHNVIERAVILSQYGRLGLTQALPESGAMPPGRDESAENDKILTDRQIRSYERENIIRALQAAKWKIAGPDGAADLLGLPPTTLSSRIKSLGISRD